jgi:hypothetical protein
MVPSSAGRAHQSRQRLLRSVPTLLHGEFSPIIIYRTACLLAHLFVCACHRLTMISLQNPWNFLRLVTNAILIIVTFVEPCFIEGLDRTRPVCTRVALACMLKALKEFPFKLVIFICIPFVSSHGLWITHTFSYVSASHIVFDAWDPPISYASRILIRTKSRMLRISFRSCHHPSMHWCLVDVFCSCVASSCDHMRASILQPTWTPPSMAVWQTPPT